MQYELSGSENQGIHIFPIRMQFMCAYPDFQAHPFIHLPYFLCSWRCRQWAFSCLDSRTDELKLFQGFASVDGSHPRLCSAAQTWGSKVRFELFEQHENPWISTHPRIENPIEVCSATSKGKGFLRSSSSTFRQLSGGGVGAGTKLFGPRGSLELCWLRSDMVRRYM